jgi:hypothetical protein
VIRLCGSLYSVTILTMPIQILLDIGMPWVASLKYSYDSNHRLTSGTDPAGGCLRSEYV